MSRTKKVGFGVLVFCILLLLYYCIVLREGTLSFRTQMVCIINTRNTTVSSMGIVYSRDKYE